MNQPQTKEAALAYLADCTLATVEEMACRRRRPKYEFERHIAIAQKTVDFIDSFNIDGSETRAHEVIKTFGSSVQKWSENVIEKIHGKE